MTDVLTQAKERDAKRDVLAGRPCVWDAIAAVIGDLPGIGKDQVQQGEGYRYRGIETITRHLQPLLAKHGVVIVPNARVVNVVASPAMKDGWQDVYVTVDWTIIGPDGSKITATTNGIGRDKSDKGANKGQTQAFKYLLLHLLCIADAADDADGHDYTEGRANQQQEDERQDARARELGWSGGSAEQRDAWTRLVDETKELDAADARDWVKAEHLTGNKLTPEHAFAWNALLESCRVTAGGDGVEGESDSGGPPTSSTPAVPRDDDGNPL